jgi:hypothetical protein
VKTRYLTLVGVVVLLFGVRAWLATGGTTPDGQPPLVDLRSLAGFKAAFNREAGKMRVIISLAPSCPYCLKGASEIQLMLARSREHQLVVFNVWQPILPTDWGKPGTVALHRLSDMRVSQFWDADRLVARAVEQSSSGRELQPSCCFQNGTWWDFIAVYPPGKQWASALPEPVLLEGTVADAAPAFEALLGR